MDKAQVREIKAVLKSLDEKRGITHPESAEKELSNAIRPILEYQGWNLMWANEAPNYHLDILAKKPRGDGTQMTDLGIELKLTKENFISDEVVHKILGIALGRELDNYLLIANRPLSRRAALIFSESAPNNLSFGDFHCLYSWLERIEKGLQPAPLQVAQLLGDMIKKLAHLVANSPSEFRQIEWRMVEQLVATVLEELGFTITLTPSSKDGGKDIIVECKSHSDFKTYIIEIKHWAQKSKVPGTILKEFLNVVINEKHTSGLFLSTSGYAGNAFEAIAELEHQRLYLGNEDKMLKLCKYYSKELTGLWHSPNRLAEILFEDTVPALNIKQEENQRKKRKKK